MRFYIVLRIRNAYIGPLTWRSRSINLQEGVNMDTCYIGQVQFVGCHFNTLQSESVYKWTHTNEIISISRFHIWISHENTFPTNTNMSHLPWLAAYQHFPRRALGALGPERVEESCWVGLQSSNVRAICNAPLWTCWLEFCRHIMIITRTCTHILVLNVSEYHCFVLAVKLQ